MLDCYRTTYRQVNLQQPFVHLCQMLWHPLQFEMLTQIFYLQSANDETLALLYYIRNLFLLYNLKLSIKNQKNNTLNQKAFLCCLVCDESLLQTRPKTLVLFVTSTLALNERDDTYGLITNTFSKNKIFMFRNNWLPRSIIIYFFRIFAAAEMPSMR